MTHYQKLAVLAFRTLAGVMMLIGLLSGLIGLVVSISASGWFGISVGLFYSLPSTIFGILLFGVSRPIARLICYDFDTFTGT